MMNHPHKRLHRQAKSLLGLVMAMTLLCSMAVPALAAGGLEMSTDYPGISVKAGDNLSFPLNFSNASGIGSNIALSVTAMPEGWDGYFEGNGKKISRVFVGNGTNASTAYFNVTVPADTPKGSYTIGLLAAGDGISSTLELELLVSEEVVGSSSLTTQYAQQEGLADTSFSFSSTIQNNTPGEQSYSLAANAPAGWLVSFKPAEEATKVAAITVPARGSQGLSIEVSPPDDTEAGEYLIPVTAVSAGDTLTSELKVVISSSQELALSTPSGLLSLDANANKESTVTLSLTNNGNTDLQNINLTSQTPMGWTITFSESTIGVLEAGGTKEVTAFVTPAKDAMSGDYATVITASTDGATSHAEFRVTVKTETIWGIVGILLILAAVAGLLYVFKKYGRR